MMIAAFILGLVVLLSIATNFALGLVCRHLLFLLRTTDVHLRNVETNRANSDAMMTKLGEISKKVDDARDEILDYIDIGFFCEDDVAFREPIEDFDDYEDENSDDEDYDDDEEEGELLWSSKDFKSDDVASIQDILDGLCNMVKTYIQYIPSSCYEDIQEDIRDLLKEVRSWHDYDVLISQTQILSYFSKGLASIKKLIKSSGR